MADLQEAVKYRYSLIPRVLVFITRGDFILLIRGAPDKKLWANLYNGIGGHVEQGEDILTAARRELYEEAGVISPDLQLCGLVAVDTGFNPGVMLFIFTGTCTNEPLASSKEGKLEWVAISAINTLSCVEDLPIILTKTLAIRKNRDIFSARSFYNEQNKLEVVFNK
jgi:8-oxo-dGTP diphosphatase